MEIEYRSVPGAEMYLPVFSEEDGVDARGAERMNRFYEHMGQCICEYAGEELRDGGYRYKARCRAAFDGEKITVYSTLMLCCHRRITAGKTLVHVWKSGILIKYFIDPKAETGI